MMAHVSISDHYQFPAGFPERWENEFESSLTKDGIAYLWSPTSYAKLASAVFMSPGVILVDADNALQIPPALHNIHSIDEWTICVVGQEVNLKQWVDYLRTNAGVVHGGVITVSAVPEAADCAILKKILDIREGSVLLVTKDKKLTHMAYQFGQRILVSASWKIMIVGLECGPVLGPPPVSCAVVAGQMAWFTPPQCTECARLAFYSEEKDGKWVFACDKHRFGMKNMSARQFVGLEISSTSREVARFRQSAETGRLQALEMTGLPDNIVPERETA